MHRNPARLMSWSLVLLVTTLISARPAAAQVKDNAHLFSSDAISKADQINAELRQRHGKQFVVETFSALPAERADELNTQGKDTFFRNWANQRAQEDRINGLYALICMNPRHVETIVGTNTLRSAFTETDRQRLTQLLISDFKEDRFDQGLVDAYQFVRDQMDSNLSASSGAMRPNVTVPSSPVGFGMGSLVCLGVGILLIVLLVRGLARNRTGGYGPPGSMPPSPGYGQGYGGAGYGGPMGGSGFGRGFLGGLLGGMLGGWGYDRLSRGGGIGYPPGGGFPGNQGLPPADSGIDTSYSGGGADFGSSSGPADMGGGADFGSSESGGGGADFGGGGGGDTGGSGGGDF